MDPARPTMGSPQSPWPYDLNFWSSHFGCWYPLVSIYGRRYGYDIVSDSAIRSLCASFFLAWNVVSSEKSSSQVIRVKPHTRNYSRQIGVLVSSHHLVMKIHLMLVFRLIPQGEIDPKRSSIVGLVHIYINPDSHVKRCLKSRYLMDDQHIY